VTLGIILNKQSRYKCQNPNPLTVPNVENVKIRFIKL